MLIMLTNDDGISSPGLTALAESLCRLGRVVIVAPDRNCSAIGHAMTLASPLRAEEIRPDVFAVDGTPTDCVNLGIHGLLKEPPDLVVSGINCGGNLGDDITYSGTVCAALEATLMGVPAFAISLDCQCFNTDSLKNSADFARKLAFQISQNGLPDDTFLNVNVPMGEVSGALFTRQGRRRYGDVVIRKEDPRGRSYYWIGGGDLGFEDIPGSDCNAIHAGMISVTPIHINLTNDDSLKTLAHWDIEQHLSD